MKKSLTLSLALAMCAGFSAVAAPTVSTDYKFADKSTLASGKWVRISVPETGVYEITYDQLREMGFSNPQNVAVYGEGGAARNFNFINNLDVAIFNDNPVQQRVLHKNNKLIFYGYGPEEIEASRDITNSYEKIVFKVNGKHLYSDVSYYFLSDCNRVQTVPVSKIQNHASATEKKIGYTYFYHELDLTQGNEGTGQNFWGENFSTDTPLKFNLTQPYAADAGAYVNAVFAVGAGERGYLSINLNNENTKYNVYSSSDSKLSPNPLTLNKSTARFNIDSNNVGTAELSFSIDNNHNDGNLLALDWYTVSCPINLEFAVDDPDFSQQYICFPSVAGSKWKFRVPNSDNIEVWDVSSRNSISKWEVEDGYAFASATAKCEMVVFNPDKTLKQIGNDWKDVANQDLHQYKNKGIELLIFSTEEMLPYANHIAQLHEQYDGIKTLVVTPTQVFNEFTNGTPDPIAYRALAKMLYQSNTKPLKNVLLIGKFSNDLRNIRATSGHSEAHLAYQQWLKNLTSHAFTIMDYYGCVTDYVGSPNDLQNVPISLGVGVIPINSSEEGANIVSKIKEHLEKKDFSNIINETFAMSCHGDEYLHDKQAADYSNLMQDLPGKLLNSGVSNNLIRFDGLTRDIRVKRFKDAIERGKMFGIYFGHASAWGLGTVNNYSPVANDLMDLNNNELGVYFMAACDLFYLDRGLQAFGDVGVTRAKRGFIGVVCSTGTVMSNENEKLARSFMNAFYYERDGKTMRTTTPTIGEAYSQAKNNESSPSQLSYVFVGDPALKLPFPLSKIDMTVEGKDFHGGEIVKLSGNVLRADGSVNSDYNGFATVKLMQPKQNVELPAAIPNTSPVQYYNYDITDQHIVTVKGEVKNGVFTVYLPLPEDCDTYMSTASSQVMLPVYAATYDPSTQLGCSGVTAVNMALDGSESDPDAVKDTQAPVLTLDKENYDPVMQTLSVAVSDDVALMPGIGNGRAISLTISGEKYNETVSLASHESVGVATSNYAATISLAHLPVGTYKVTGSAVDLAGNRTEKDRELTIEITETAPLTLTTPAEYVIAELDEVEFSIKGNTDETLSLILTDLNGKTVYKTDFTGNLISCGVSELEPGIYRAAVRHESAKGSRLYSNWVQFTVID